MQAIPWIVDVGYTVMCVALMLAVMGHVLFGEFEVTMVTMSDSISGGRTVDCCAQSSIAIWQHIILAAIPSSSMLTLCDPDL